jgi:acyl-CoA synthetase (NDP forming)/GNAT superfamily N-acetyltransferase
VHVDREQWSTSVVLGDGETAFVRPMTADDAPLLLAFHERQPKENLYRRFFSPKPTLSAAELKHFTEIDFRDRVALVLELRGEFIAWASYERWSGRDDADVAFMVDADHQGKGIATLLLEHLAAIARANGITRFTAEVLSDNRNMLRVFARAGWPVERHFDSGIAEIEFPLTDTDAFIDSVEGREHRADARAITRLLLPRSIAVIGASDRPGTVGRELWRNTSRQFDGPVYAVNPRHDTIGGRPAYASLAAIDDDVTLALIAVPASDLRATIDACIAKKVRGAVIVTAVDGTDVDVAALVAHARRNGMRLIGPSSMGIAAAHEPRLDAALIPVRLAPGGVAMSIQSGTLGASLLRLADGLSMGLSWFVSLGDKCDVSGNDLLQFWEDDEHTTVIAIYTESFGNPRKFARLARRVGQRKPIVAVRTGTAAIGSASDALYQQSGLVEVPTVRELLDTARVFATQPLPRGPRVAILTNSRSPGVLAEAALRAAGLVVVPPPVGLDWRSAPGDYSTALAAALADDGVDAVLVVHAPPIAAAPAPIDEIDRTAAGAAKPVVAVLLGRNDGPVRDGSNVPSFSFPEPAAAVLGRMEAHRRWRDTEAVATIEPPEGLDDAGVAEVLVRALERGDDRLGTGDVVDVLARYGVAVAPMASTTAASADAVADVAERLGFPVAVKAAHRTPGRSARAGVALDLRDRDAVVEAVEVIRESLGDDATTLYVQRMAQPGIDVRIHTVTDPRLGAVITVGLGSLQSPALADGVSRLAPLSRVGADTMVRSSAVGPALDAAGLDATGLVDTIVRVAQLADHHPEIAEIEIDPVLVAHGVCTVTDVRIEVRATDHVDPPLRRLG